MNSIVQEFIDFTKEKQTHKKEDMISSIQTKFGLKQDRKVYFCQHFAVRVNYSKKGSFSNTILSLSTLQKYDHIPFFVILVCGNSDNQIYLANSTFLKKISHSSQELSETNIKGSFNGSDIMKSYNGINNNSDNFNQLFDIHKNHTWEENLYRLVDSTRNIKSIMPDFVISEKIRKTIYSSIDRAKFFIESDNFEVLYNELNKRVDNCKKTIWWIALNEENTNIRGRLIESLITANIKEQKDLIDAMKNNEGSLPIYKTKNELADYYKEFDDENIFVDIKTKILYKKSNPAAYNIDKFLKVMSLDKSVFFFYFIGFDRNNIIKTALCSVYHDCLIDNTVVQHHWSARGSRGSTQFKGNVINCILQKDVFINRIQNLKSKRFLDKLIKD
ncbi:MAG: hypothetical protein GX963_00515 [Bacteroidales bacterium]|nr:hypothetical protein [Bacteroidales bacterium]